LSAAVWRNQFRGHRLHGAGLVQRLPVCAASPCRVPVASCCSPLRTHCTWAPTPRRHLGSCQCCVGQSRHPGHHRARRPARSGCRPRRSPDCSRACSSSIRSYVSTASTRTPAARSHRCSPIVPDEAGTRTVTFECRKPIPILSLESDTKQTGANFLSTQTLRKRSRSPNSMPPDRCAPRNQPSCRQLGSSDDRAIAAGSIRRAFAGSIKRFQILGGRLLFKTGMMADVKIGRFEVWPIQLNPCKGSITASP